jgi:hypothetical protein
MGDSPQRASLRTYAYLPCQRSTTVIGGDKVVACGWQGGETEKANKVVSPAAREQGEHPLVIIADGDGLHWVWVLAA